MSTSYEENARRLERGPVWDLLKLRVVDAREGWATVSMPIGPEILQQLGHVHGGILMTLLDSVMAAALSTLLADSKTAVTTQLNTHFLRPGIGPVLYGDGRVVRFGAHLTVTDGSVRDHRGAIVATGSAQFMVLGSNPS